MEITLETIISGLAWLFGGSGLGWFITWRWQKAKAKAEAKQAEAEAKQKEADAKTAEIEMAQKIQDTYQEMLEDKNKEVEDNHRLITELRADRDHYRQGYIEIRDEMEKLSKEFRNFRSETEEDRAKMKRDIARNGRQMEAMRPFMCGDLSCKVRQRVTTLDAEALERTIHVQKHEPEDIDPIDSDAL